MIAIKDIKEMPSCCYECPYFDDYCALTGKWESDTEQIRDNDCPLVEIVTCKDCKYRDKVHSSWLSNKKDEVYFCTLQSDEYCYEVEDDHFCADGERRE